NLLVYLSFFFQLVSNMVPDKCQLHATDNNYNRGLLFPRSYGFSETDKISTFTVTNIVPQEVTFSKGSWNKMETCVKCVMEKYCMNSNNRIKGYLVTGAEPGNKLLNNKTNIPSVMWSAFCCYSSREQRWIASAHWGNNVPEEPTGKYMETETLTQLKLRKSSAFVLFPGSHCPSDTTVTDFYPEFNDQKDCNCPPTS
ncbi:hypothetical protein NL108_017036, partial [Boleophthalmus pectinirostris]